jgi:thiamine biosynthesis lipoprotein
VTAACRAAVHMSTFVTIEVVGTRDCPPDTPAAQACIDRAFAWFDEVEACCTRFDPDSELMRLSAEAGTPVPASPLLFEAVQFAVAVAESSDGAFDPTVGRRMERAGFDRHHRSAAVVDSPVTHDGEVSYRDITLDVSGQTITLARPLVLDLGGVAKGLAVDMAARELAPFENFAINAGGDLYLSGLNAQGAAWSVGIRHPRADGVVIDALHVSDRAVCTSGDYERAGRAEGSHHILDPRTGVATEGVASVTVVGPTTIVADALATAAFVIAARDVAEAVRWLDAQGVDGLIYTASLERQATRGLQR